MLDILYFLKTYSEALTILFTAVVTLSTTVYAWLTYILVKETRKMREAQTEPKIQITIDSFDFAIHIIRLNIENIGLGPAYKIKFESSIISGNDSAENLLNELTESNFFKTGIRYLGPAKNLYSSFSKTNQDFEGKSASILSFKVDYESAIGKKYSDDIIIDMSEIKGRYQLGKPSLYSIAKSLEKIQTEINSVITGSKRIKTDIYLHADREKEKEELTKWYEEESTKWYEERMQELSEAGKESDIELATHRTVQRLSNKKKQK